jgi:hypothetical protein
MRYKSSSFCYLPLIFVKPTGFDRGKLSNPLDHLVAALDKHFVECIPIQRAARFCTKRAKICVVLYTGVGPAAELTEKAAAFAHL